jgi:pantothenate kinase-related protein Tda10
LNIPKKQDGTEYQLHELSKEQLNIACIILSKLREWIDLSTKIGNNKEFQPLRMTVTGGGGTGKSTLINTLVTIIHQIFQDNDSVHVLAPTGAAAFNVGGQTIH